MACVAKGDLQARGRRDAGDEMGELTCEINRTLDSLQRMYEEVQQSHATLERWNLELEGKIKERTAALQNLLDYAGQGFLSFGGDLQIDKEYSAECTAIFRREIAGENACALLCPEAEAQQKRTGRRIGGFISRSSYLQRHFRSIAAASNHGLLA